jgi:uncharacterized protein
MTLETDHHAAIIAKTIHWLLSCVIGLNLCPFARAVHLGDRVRYFVSNSTTTAELINDLERELRLLERADPNEMETTLLIHPGVLDEFLDFNDFLAVADRLIESLQLVGVIQIASFHPQFQFADLASSDIGNYTNRSPYPILHLLRESSVEQAIASMADTSEIYRKNLQTMKALGLDGWLRLNRE